MIEILIVLSLMNLIGIMILYVIVSNLSRKPLDEDEIAEMIANDFIRAVGKRK